MARTLPIRLRTIAAALVVLCSGLIIWNAYQSIIATTDEVGATLPVIKADNRPWRREPEDRGGAKIPNQGNALFDVLNVENQDDLALDGVNINRDPQQGEEPISLFDGTPQGKMEGFSLPDIPERTTESLFDVMPEETPGDDRVQPITQDDQDQVQQKLKQAIERAETQAQIQVEAPPSTQKEFQNQQSDDIKPAPKVAKDETTATAFAVIPVKKPTYSPPKKSVGAFSLDKILAKDNEAEPAPKQYYIQLASLRTEAEARLAYDRIRDNFPAVVRGVGVTFPQANLGARGTFTRIHVGPMNGAEARKRCADYTSAPGGGTCLVLSK